MATIEVNTNANTIINTTTKTHTSNPLHIVALVSGSGSNLQAIINFIERSSPSPLHIVATIADRPAKALARASQHTIPSYLCSKKANSTPQQHIYDIDVLLQQIQPDLIVLAGFLGILPRWFTLCWDRRIVNIHPSLLPKFGGKGMYGIKVHEAVLNAKEQKTGCTVHWVSEEVDGGTIIAQKFVPVLPNDSPSDLQQRVLVAEHQLYVDTLVTLATQKTT